MAYAYIHGPNEDRCAAQLQVLRAFAKRRGLTISQVFADVSGSGGPGIFDLPNLASLVLQKRKTPDEAVIVAAPSVFGPDRFTQGVVLRYAFPRPPLFANRTDAEENGHRLVFENIEMLERFKHSRLFHAATAYDARGLGSGARPYGELPSEQETLDQMLSLRNAGLGYTAISRELTRLGYCPRRGKRWHPYSVCRILKARMPIG
jgi:hypothetical protein